LRNSGSAGNEAHKAVLYYLEHVKKVNVKNILKKESPLFVSDLFGDRNIVEVAIDRIKSFEFASLKMDDSGYWVAVSGGKDSSVIYDLVKKWSEGHVSSRDDNGRRSANHAAYSTLLP
jgi:predicted PP-loop superfamily ATPase